MENELIASFTIPGEPISPVIIASFTIPGEPISPVNHYKARAVKIRNKWTAMMYLESKFKNYKQSVEEIVKNYSPISTPVKVEAIFYFGTKRRKDLPNSGKLEWDALNGFVWDDDSQILKLNTEKRYDKDNPRTEIKVFNFSSEHWPAN
jgi:Holliday junction resolvase RusA-like endonuclease